MLVDNEKYTVEKLCYSVTKSTSLRQQFTNTLQEGVVEEEFFSMFVVKDEEILSDSRSEIESENGFTDDRSDSGPSVAILLHKASQLLITSVSLPFSSPTSTCNGCTSDK
ncbi:hypothetical protein AQUCO_07200023v1 [Aquilegia coerulea]|uniref:Uncharacterized protein n=1 Tax=Aquilegia coerulea TaxID=218851 RepID=A0A2G5C9Z9_AQUCA|nr:hypothetical protein AQUCO_07200023v1 [Aquilegia coerulea]